MANKPVRSEQRPEADVDGRSTIALRQAQDERVAGGKPRGRAQDERVAGGKPRGRAQDERVAGGKPRGRAQDERVLRDALAGIAPNKRHLFSRSLSEEQARALDPDWPTFAHDGQRPPHDDWSTWVICAGRGFGKTRAGAEWVAAEAARAPIHIALVGASLDDARKVMVEGVSGLLTVAGPDIADWRPSIGRLTFHGGAVASLFSGGHPDKLRGPEHHLAWCDELAKWPRAEDSWTMLQMGLRLGTHPRVLVTTTPRDCETLRRIMADPATVVTNGPTFANPHLPEAYKAAMRRLYGGTRLGKQELDGVMPDGRPGQLFPRWLLEKCRITPSGPLAGEAAHGNQNPFTPNTNPVRVEPFDAACGGAQDRHSRDAHAPTPFDYAQDERREGETGEFKNLTFAEPLNTLTTRNALGITRPQRPLPPRRRFHRIAIGLDPPADGGTCGIVVCAIDWEGIGHVIEDLSVTGASPEGWACAVADAWRRWWPEADEAVVVAEVNQGGDMVRAVLRQQERTMRVRDVRARQGKAVRAEPVAMLFEQGRVRLHGRMEALEGELLRFQSGGQEGRRAIGKSPDRADAMVWGMTELMVRVRREPRVSVI